MDSIYDAAVKEGFAIGLVEGKAEGVAIGTAEGVAIGKAEGVVIGKAEGKAEMFLVFAWRKFKQVPEEWAEQVRSAAPEQLDDWLLQAYDTDVLASVFNGSVANGDGRVRKKPNGGS